MTHPSERCTLRKLVVTVCWLIRVLAATPSCGTTTCGSWTPPPWNVAGRNRPSAAPDHRVGQRYVRGTARPLNATALTAAGVLARVLHRIPRPGSRSTSSTRRSLTVRRAQPGLRIYSDRWEVLLRAGVSPLAPARFAPGLWS